MAPCRTCVICCAFVIYFLKNFATFETGAHVTHVSLKMDFLLSHFVLSLCTLFIASVQLQAELKNDGPGLGNKIVLCKFLLVQYRRPLLCNWHRTSDWHPIKKLAALTCPGADVMETSEENLRTEDDKSPATASKNGTVHGGHFKSANIQKKKLDESLFTSFYTELIVIRS